MRSFSEMFAPRSIFAEVGCAGNGFADDFAALGTARGVSIRMASSPFVSMS
jgi:hypothetical protein